MHKCFLPYLNFGYIKSCFYCWHKNLLTITRSRTQKRSGFKNSRIWQDLYLLWGTMQSLPWLMLSINPKQNQKLKCPTLVY
jgi:hypothetical protein